MPFPPPGLGAGGAPAPVRPPPPFMRPRSPVGGPAGPGGSPAASPGANLGKRAASVETVRALVGKLLEVVPDFGIGTKEFNAIQKAITALNPVIGHQLEGETTAASRRQLAAVPQPPLANAAPPGVSPPAMPGGPPPLTPSPGMAAPPGIPGAPPSGAP